MQISPIGPQPCTTTRLLNRRIPVVLARSTAWISTAQGLSLIHIFCSKEINLVGSWVYTLRDYATTFDFLKRAKAIGLPMDELITHTYPLEEINEAHQTNLAQKGLKIAIINK